jgi:hypothetical protein
MRVPLFKTTLIVFALISITALSSLFLSGTAQQEFDKKAVIKLYSGDKLVATWNATSVGQVDGNSYVFTVGTSPRPTQVRISGTYSVETVP